MVSHGVFTIVDISDGAQWYSGVNITEDSTTPTIFLNSGITYAVEGDMYLNTSTQNTYRCVESGDSSSAKWVYVNNIKGDTGKGISSIKSQYYLHTSDTNSPADNVNWEDAPPNYQEDYYYWTRSYITWSDGSSPTTTTPVLDMALTNANKNAVEAKEEAEEAAKVATNYLSVDNTGIMIANMQGGEKLPGDQNLTGKNVFIDNDSVDIRDGLNVSASFESDNITFYNADYNEEIATFGTRGARIGKNNEQHFLVDAESLQAINENGSSIFSISSTNATMNSVIKVADGVDCGWSSSTITLEDAGYTNETFFIEKTLLKIRYPDSNLKKIHNTLVYPTGSLLKTFTGKGSNIELPKISFTYGTSDQVQYTITFNSTFNGGPDYTYTGSLTISYDGDRTFTFYPYNGSWVCESDPTYSGSHNPSYPSSYNVPSIMAHGTSKAPSMTFGTREVNNEIAPFSTTIGEGLYANSDNQLSIGKYNLNNDPLTNPFMFVIGNGQDDSNRSNALEVDQYGNLNVNGNMRCNSNYLVATKSYYWNNTVGANSAWQVNNYDVTIPGYTAVGVVSFGLHNQDSGGRNADWCIVPRCILWGGSTQNLEFYVWNQHTSQSAIVTMMVKILYVPSSIFGALS